VRIIVLCEGLGLPGAVANVAWQQALGLSLSHPVCLISDGLSVERRQQWNRSRGRLRIHVLQVPGFTGLRRFGHLPRQLSWILKALLATATELSPGDRATVICHSHPLAAAIALRFGRDVRLLMVSHGDVFSRPPGSYDPAITFLYRRTARAAHRRADTSIALSPAMALRIQAHGVAPQRIALIPNGLEPEEIGLDRFPASPSLDHWLQRPLRLLFVGRLDQVKGVDVLLQAITMAHQQDTDLELELIAHGTPRQLQDLDQRIQALGLADVVRLIGPRPRHILADHYLRCHAVVVPSLDDPLPTVILEAMACARPVLASRVGGIPYLLQDGQCGLLVPPADPCALANGIIRLDQDRSLASALAEHALERSRHFSWEANVKALHSLIASAPS
jgi:glycosyltransferase involved in cell wall biosynthesis